MDIAKLNENFYYDGVVLRNKKTRGSRALKDARSGGKHHSGYYHVRYENKFHMVHRIIWVMVTGKDIPEGYEIDHINHVRDDNRIDNLRMVTVQENRRNQRLTARNTSGCIGVSKYTPRNMWQAQIKVNGKNMHLGFYDEFDDAVSVRKEAEKKYNFHKNHGGK